MAMVMQGDKITAKFAEQGQAGMNAHNEQAQRQAGANNINRGDMAAMGG
jgi:hypothetical protein